MELIFKEKGGNMNDIFSLADELGPLKVIHVHEPSIGLKGILVVDNVARGPSVGGGAHGSRCYPSENVLDWPAP